MHTIDLFFIIGILVFLEVCFLFINDRTTRSLLLIIQGYGIVHLTNTQLLTWAGMHGALKYSLIIILMHIFYKIMIKMSIKSRNS